MVRVAGSGGLAGKTLLIAGAGCAAGRVLTAALAQDGATVIALDTDTTTLFPLAQQYPDKVELLAMDLRQPALVLSMGAIWADEPLHGFISLLALLDPDDLALSCQTPVGLLRAFAPGLRMGQGAALLVWPDRDADPMDAAHRAGSAALTDALDRADWAPPGGVHMVEIGAVDSAPLTRLLALLLHGEATRFRGGRFRLTQVV